MNEVYKYRLKKNKSCSSVGSDISNHLNVNGINIFFSETESEYEADMSVLQYADRLVDFIDPDEKYRNLYESTNDENAAVLSFYKYDCFFASSSDYSESLTLFIKENDGIEVTVISTGDFPKRKDTLISKAEQFLERHKFMTCISS